MNDATDDPTIVRLLSLGTRQAAGQMPPQRFPLSVVQPELACRISPSANRLHLIHLREISNSVQSLLERDFPTEAPDRLWVADVTYIPAMGFLYLAVVFDACSRRIGGWVDGHTTGEFFSLLCSHR
jgi:transposase InsO family protein